MKIVKLRDKVDKTILSVALFFLISPIIGLITGTAHQLGTTGSDYQQASLIDDPEQYWQIIIMQLTITLAIGIQGFITFPALIAARRKVLNFRDNNKIVANIIFYLLTPVFFIALLIFLIYLFEL